MSSPFIKVKERIFENSIGFVIYDKFAVSKGHCLIIPKREYPDYFESTNEEIIGLNNLLFQNPHPLFFSGGVTSCCHPPAPAHVLISF